MATYNEGLQRIVRDYRENGQPWPATAKQIAGWAISNGSWKPQRSELLNQCAEHIARAMREEYFTDPQGRSVRAKHAAKIERDGEQLVLWADIRTAPRQHMAIAFKLRRNQIVDDCRHLKTDVDSFNENRSPLDPIQMVFDFTFDLAELEAVAV
jgi:hypothetical protein